MSLAVIDISIRFTKTETSTAATLIPTPIKPGACSTDKTNLQALLLTKQFTAADAAALCPRIALSQPLTVGVYVNGHSIHETNTSPVNDYPGDGVNNGFLLSDRNLDVHWTSSGGSNPRRDFSQSPLVIHVASAVQRRCLR